MQLSEILDPRAVRDAGRLGSKKRILQEIAEIAADVYGVDPGTVLDALQEREALGPTGVGEGIALPHARLPGLEKVRGVFLRLDRPVDYESVDREPVDLVFALLAPEEAGVEHLRALARVSRTLRDATVAEKLRRNRDETALYAILAEAPPDIRAA